MGVFCKLLAMSLEVMQAYLLGVPVDGRVIMLLCGLTTGCVNGSGGAQHHQSEIAEGILPLIRVAART